jgi:hypothetical protein
MYPQFQNSVGTLLKSGKKPVAINLNKRYENDAYMIHFQNYGYLVAYEKWLLSLQKID